VYLLRRIISIPVPLFKRGGHFVASFLHFVADGGKKRAARGGCARSGALGQPGAGHVVQSGVLYVGYSSAGILRNSLMGYAPVMLISLSWNTRKYRYPGPACAYLFFVISRG